MEIKCLFCEEGIKFLAYVFSQKETVGPNITMLYAFPILTFEIVD
jgi:hypothetical protein